MTARLLQGLRAVGAHALAILTSRSVVVVSSTCAILYAAFWVVGVLQTDGILSTALPVPLANTAVLGRGGAVLKPASVTADEQAVRNRALAQASTAPSASGAAAAKLSNVTLEVQTAPPVQLWVFDAAGNGAGTNPDTGLVRLQFPGASYSGRGTNPQLVSIPNALGSYHIQLIGTASGHFDMRVRVFLGNDLTNATEYAGSGQVYDNTLLQADADVSLGSNGAPKLNVTPAKVVVVGNAPSPSASTSPSPSASASSSESASPSASPSANPQPPADLAVAGQVAGAQTAPNQAPAGTYGNPPALREFQAQRSQPLQQILQAPSSVYRALTGR